MGSHRRPRGRVEGEREVTTDQEGFLPPPPAAYRLGDAATFAAAHAEADEPEPGTPEAYAEKWTDGDETFRNSFKVHGEGR